MAHPSGRIMTTFTLWLHWPRTNKEGTRNAATSEFDEEPEKKSCSCATDEELEDIAVASDG
jgi:hypothetical protein